MAAYDAQDRLQTDGAATYTFGKAGDLQSRTQGTLTTGYVYDAIESLISAQLPDRTQLDYLVDAQGRRVGKKVSSTLVQGFLWESQLRVADLDGSGKVVSRFVYGTKVNVPELVIKGSTTYPVITDHRGSPRLVVNASDGTVAQRVDYDEWGNVLADSQPGFQPFGFAGGLYDRDLGVVRFGARDYEPTTGRWTANDPARFAGGFNFYACAANNALRYVDRDGRIVVLADDDARRMQTRVSGDPLGNALLDYLQDSPIVYTIYGNATPLKGETELGVTGERECGGKPNPVGLDVSIFKKNGGDWDVLLHELGHAALYDYALQHRFGLPSGLDPSWSIPGWPQAMIDSGHMKLYWESGREP